MWRHPTPFGGWAVSPPEDGSLYLEEALEPDDGLATGGSEEWDPFDPSGGKRAPLAIVNPLDPLDCGGEPDTVPRRCTDSIWLLVFALALGALGYVAKYAVDRGNLDSLRALADFQGNLCGHDAMRDSPYLFFCQDRPGRLNFLPICVDSCPKTANSTHRCFDNSTRTSSGDWKEVEDYPSFEYIGMLCRPLDRRLVRAQQDWINQNPPIAPLSTLRRAWHPLAAAAMFAVFNSYVYITLLKYCASCLVWTGLTTLTVVPLAFGAKNLYCWHYGTCDANSVASELTLGVLLTLVGFVFACMACRLGESIDLAISCIEWSCKCILETPSLRVEPLISVTLRGASIAGLLYTLALLVSLGREDTVARRVVWGPDAIACMAVVMLVGFWIQQALTCLSDFVVAYVTEMWYFRGGLQGEGGAPAFAVGKAYCVALRYHLGSILFGSLVIGLVQPIRMAVGAITSVARMEENPVGIVIGGCCICLVECYQSLLDFISRKAYIDVVLNAKPWCQAADHALKVVKSEAGTVQILNGATWLFQLAGFTCIIFLGHGLTYGVIKAYPAFTEQDSPQFVPNPEISCMAGATISGIVAFPFMMLFDMVSDTILYCRTVERQRQWKPTSVLDRACGGNVAVMFGDFTGCTCGGTRPLRSDSPSLREVRPASPSGATNPFEADLVHDPRAAELARLAGKGAGKGSRKGRGKGLRPGDSEADAESWALLSPS